MIIYKITNRVNGKTYIGMSGSNDPSYLGSGVAIKSAIRKYGKENFVKEILESNFNSYQGLAKAEVKWIALEKQKNPNGLYNMNGGGLGCSSNKGKKSEQIYGKKRSEEWKNKISSTLIQKGIRPPSRIGVNGSDRQKLAAANVCRNRIRSKEEISKLVARTARKIYCHQTQEQYRSIKEAADTLGLSNGNICLVLKGDRSHTKGYTFRYVK